MTKIDRITNDMTKVREKITLYQDRLKELEADLMEAENMEILRVVRAANLTPGQLTDFLRKNDLTPAGRQGRGPSAPANNRGAQEEKNREDNNDETQI
jgi:hypothetical protein